MSYTKDSVRTLITRIFLMFINLLGGIIKARCLGPEGIGIFALLLLVPIFCFRFLNFGFGSSFSFFVAKKKASVKDLFKYVWLIGSLMALLSCFILSVIWENHFLPWHDLPPVLFYLSFLMVPLMFYINFLRRILGGLLKIKTLNIADIIYSFSSIVFLILLVVIFKFGVLGAICAIILSRIIELCYILFHIPSSNNTAINTGKTNSEERILKQLWHYGRWNYLIMLNNFFFEQFPLVLLKYFYPNDIVGFFSVAKGLMKRLQLLPETFSRILFPFTATSKENEATRRTNTVCRIFFIIMGGILLLVAFTLKPIVNLLYGKAFYQSIIVCYALLPAIFFFSLFKFLNVHIAASGNSKLASIVGISAIPANFVFCFLLIPLYGAVGAAFSVSITNAILAIICLFVYIKFTKTKLRNVIIPNKSDWVYYQRVFNAGKLKVQHKFGIGQA